MQDLVEFGTAGEVLSTFKWMHTAVADLERTRPTSSVVVDWFSSSLSDFTFTPSDFRRFLPGRRRVNLVGAIGTGPVGEGERAEGAGPLPTWDELSEELRMADREKAEIQRRATAEADELKRQLTESERRRLELKTQLKETTPNCSTFRHSASC